MTHLNSTQLKHLLPLILLYWFSQNALAQAVSINTDGSAPDSSAILDVKSADKGVLFPRMSEAARLAISSPAEGLMVWDTSYNDIWGYDGIQWHELSSKWERFGDHIQNVYPGNVGIGEYSVGASLYIRKPGPSISMYDEARPSTSGTMRGDSNNLEIFANRILNPFTNDDEPGHLILQADQDLGMFGLYATGNVGIGHDDPPYKLTLEGTMGFYDGGTLYGLVFANSNQMAINAKTGSVLGGDPQDLLLQTSTGLFALTGSVGIGIQTPLAKLHVSPTVMIGAGAPAAGYALSVNGKIMAEEMRIEDSGTWPDFVFGEKYALRSLDALQQHIDSSGHLPGVPSASDIEVNGIMIGEMQKLQMEKIEELTLYILQLHERIKDLEAATHR
jgi:hypothetical protein